MTSIGSSAFANCNSLTSVTIDIEEPLSIKEETFSNRRKATLYVPYGCKAAYEAANYWKEFKEIVEMPASDDKITLSSVGKGTYCSTADLDFTGITGLKAYIASGYDYDSGSVLLTRVYKVPAGTGLMLMGEAGTYEVPHMETNYTYVNMLKGVTATQTLEQTSDGYTNYILMNGADGVLFYKVKAEGGSIAANRAYLQIPTRSANASKLDFILDDETATGISNHQREAAASDGRCYNLNGQRVSAPKKGLYIVNGKKVVVK